VRTDPQIAEVYGRPDHALVAFPECAARLQAAGDYWGVHPHPIRWAPECGQWVHEFGDGEWLAQSTRFALDAFGRWAGAPPRLFRAGAGFLKVVSQSLPLSYQTYLATEPCDLDSAFATMTRNGARSLVMLSSTTLSWFERKRIADLALKYRLPTMSEGRDWVEAECLMSYALSFDVRVRDQPQDREGPRPHDSAGGAGAGGRDHRMRRGARRPDIP